jgi:CHASE2 domain-containing sensor protein
MLNSKKIYKLFKNRLFTTIFLSFIIFIFLIFSTTSKLLYSQDKNLQRAIQTSFNPNTEFTDNVAILAIDEKTLENL